MSNNEDDCLDIEFLEGSEVLKVLKDFEDEPKVFEALLLKGITRISEELACIREELKELRKLKEMIG